LRRVRNDLNNVRSGVKLYSLTHSLTPEIVRVREVDLQKRDEPTPDLEIPKNVHSFIRAFVTE